MSATLEQASVPLRDSLRARKLTVPQERATGVAMSRLLSLLIGLAMLASMAVGSVAHANEQACIPGIEASFAGHADGDSDQVPSDSEKGYPHHHGGCHGHHVATPLDGRHDARSLEVASRHGAFTPVALHAAAADPALRPPIA